MCFDLVYLIDRARSLYVWRIVILIVCVSSRNLYLMRMKKGLMEGNQLPLLYPIILSQLPNMIHELRIVNKPCHIPPLIIQALAWSRRFFIFTMPLVP